MTIIEQIQSLARYAHKRDKELFDECVEALGTRDKKLARELRAELER